MDTKQKRVAAIHDISCVGRCSLTVALPILSAAGIETSVIPTAILSTHTGGFQDYSFRNLTEGILPIGRHWQSLGIGFDAMYSGYLGSHEQVDIVAELFDMFQAPSNAILVDPVMADDGVLYDGFAPDFPAHMARLCARANAITPNMTEAFLLLGEDYHKGPYERAFVEDLLHRLADLGPKAVFLSGVHFDAREIGAAVYDSATEEIGYAFSESIPGSFVGTGDIFASVLLAALLSDCGDLTALDMAVDFVAKAIRRSVGPNYDYRFGVNFEYGLAELSQMLKPKPSKRKAK